MDVEVSYDQEGEHKIGKKNFWWDGVDPVVHSISRIGVNDPERMETGAKKWLVRGDIKGEDVVHPLKVRKHRVVGKKRHMKVGSHAWLPNRRKKGLETTEGGKLSLVDRWIL